MAQKHNSDKLKHMQRFSDMLAEPGRMLTPIQGYEKMPLVSLEEATEPLIPYVSDVKRMVYVAKQKCEKPPPDNLSLDESASIMLYSMEWESQSVYRVLNAELRSENRHKLKPWFLYLKLIFTALARLPSLRLTVYRGIKLSMGRNFSIGKTVIWWGFSSCTRKLHTLQDESFMGTQGTRTMFAIECLNGKDIRRHSQFPQEDEILLMPARNFKVLSNVHQEGDLTMIQLEEIEPPHPLIELISLDNKKPVDHKKSVDNKNPVDNTKPVNKKVVNSNFRPQPVYP